MTQSLTAGSHKAYLDISELLTAEAITTISLAPTLNITSPPQSVSFHIKLKSTYFLQEAQLWSLMAFVNI